MISNLHVASFSQRDQQSNVPLLVYTLCRPLVSTSGGRCGVVHFLIRQSPWTQVHHLLRSWSLSQPERNALKKWLRAQTDKQRAVRESRGAAEVVCITRNTHRESGGVLRKQRAGFDFSRVTATF